MKKWSRRQGLIVFILILGAGLAATFLYADRFLKDRIEEKGTEIVGAKVELAEVKLSFFPLRVSLSGLQVTNPDQPMKNAVEIDRADFSVDWPKLFLHKIVIDEMTLQGVRFDTDRKTSGAIVEQGVKTADRRPEDKKSSSPSRFDFPSFDKVRDIPEIQEKEELESLKLAKSIEYDINTIKNRWQTKLFELPDQKKIKNYEKRIRKLKKLAKGSLLVILGNIARNADELTSLYHDLNRDYKRIKSARKDIRKDYKRLKKRIKQLEKLPQKDSDRLREKYQISPQGLSNISGMLFGEEIGKKVETALVWYRKIQPILDGGRIENHPEQGKGKNLHFPEAGTLPDFLVRQIDVFDLQTGLGVMSGKIQNLTPDQPVLGKPLTFAFWGKELKEIKSASLDGVFNHVVPGASMDTLVFQAREYQVKNLGLSNHSWQTISLHRGLANLDIKLVLAGEKLKGEITADLNPVEFSVGAGQEKERILSSLLSGISKFNLTARIIGTIRDYRVELKSDLDRILNDALAALVKDQFSNLEKSLGSQDIKKGREPLEELNEKLIDFKSLEADLSKRLQKLETIKRP